jgi:hypothetical protein
MAQENQRQSSTEGRLTVQLTVQLISAERPPVGPMFKWFQIRARSGVGRDNGMGFAGTGVVRSCEL